MAIVINGSGTVTGLAVGGLPDGTVDSDTLASGIDKTSISDSGDATAITIDSSENVIIGASSFDQGGFSGSATGINVHGVSPLVLCKETDTNIRGYIGVAGSDMYVITPDARNLYLGTNDAARIAIDPTGAVTMPAQPAFQAKPSTDQNNIAQGADVTIIYGTEVFDQNSDFNSNVFTAPVTGKYQLNSYIRLNNVDTAPAYYQFKIKTSNRTYTTTYDTGGFSEDPAYYSFSHSVLADMDAGDTAYVAIHQHSAGTAQTDVDPETTFSGYLVC